MTLDPQFLDWMNATIVLENVLGTSSGGYGARLFGSPVPVMARLEQFIEKAQSHEGKEVVTRGRLYMSPIDAATSAGGGQAISVRPPDRVTIPNGYIVGAGPSPRIINVEQHNDENGSPMFYEVLI